VSGWPIRTIGDPALREPARAVDPEAIRQGALEDWIAAMIATMRAANGAGIAATQLDREAASAPPLTIPQAADPTATPRACVVEVRDNPRYPWRPRIPLLVLVNPVVVPLSEERFDHWEGCLSVPDLRGLVARHVHIRVEALDRTGAPLTLEAAGLKAGVLQHELDHLDGALFVDRVADPRTLCTVEHFRRHHEPGYLPYVRDLVERWGE